jgi:hypothetical protein
MGATSRFQTMFERLRALQGETTSLPQVVTTWFESTLSDLEEVTGPTTRSKALRALGILRHQDWQDFNTLFKNSVGYENAPVTKDPVQQSSAQDKTPEMDNEVHRRTRLTLTEEKESSGQKRRRGETAHGVVVRLES